MKDVIDTQPDVFRRNYREPDALTSARIDSIKALGDTFMELLESYRPAREFSIARTKLEEAVMWAVKGVTAQTD